MTTEKRYPMTIKVVTADQKELVWNFRDSKKLELLIDAYKENLESWESITITIATPEVASQIPTWTVQKDSVSDSDYPPENCFVVMLPNGKWQGTVAVTEGDALETVRGEWNKGEYR